MAKIEIETKRLIGTYYDKLIKEKQNNLEDEENKCREDILNKFNNDSDVLAIRHLFSKLDKKYGGDCLKLYCDIYKSWITPRNEKILKIKQQIEELKKEELKLFVTLENNSKNSKAYKTAFNNFYEKI